MNEIPLSRTQRISPDHEQLQTFAKHGFLIVPDFVDPLMCAQLRDAITRYAEGDRLIDVNLAASRFLTFNGPEVDQYLPSLTRLYDHDLLSVLQALHNPIGTIRDRRIGLSINVTPAGGHFQPHFDRHRLTAVLYVTDDFEGGEMLLFPRIRYWLGRTDSQLRNLLQRALDKMVRSPIYQKLFCQQVSFKPRAGSLLIFEGLRTLHQVRPVTGTNNRISIQFAYDQPGTEYDVSDYYGL